MTKKEAIPILRELEAYFTDLIEANPHFLDKEQAEKDLEAIRYGRNSLEVDEQYQLEYEQAEYCEDCISRESMLNAITEIDDNCNMNIYTNEVRDIVNELPSVQPKPRKAFWKPCSVYGKCSNCEWLHIATDLDAYKYCPGCGAEMEQTDERNR